MKKKFIYGLASLASIALLASCDKNGENEERDETKAIITVSTFDGGVGDEWLKKAANKFMDANQDRTDFQEGRTGVQIIVKCTRSVAGNTIKDASLLDDIYFTEGVDYYYMTNKDKLADITDIMETPIEEDGGKKIIDKIDGNLAGFLNRNGKYYAIPFYDNYYGLNYDKDLFAEKGFYMTNDGSFTKKASEFGTGPNGVAGDWDDGLPRTYDEFEKMMKRMVDMGVVPFTYATGAGKDYPARALVSWWSDYEGYDQMQLNYNFSGTDSSIVKVDSSNKAIFDDNGDPVTETVTIDRQNGYLLKRQAGRYHALDFARNILTSSSRNYVGYGNNDNAQRAFVNNKLAGGSAKPIAMLFEGCWWENEAEMYGSFDDARSLGHDDFNYGFMPIPKVKETGDATLTCLNDSFGFINANTSNLKLAKEFMAFLHTDASLSSFTAETSMTRSLNYKLKEEDKSSVSSYGLSLMDIKESDHAKVVYPFSSLDFVIDNTGTFGSDFWSWNSKTLTNNPVIKFIEKEDVTAEQFFNEVISSIDESSWKGMVNN